jgi:hypothetical protein
MAEKAAGQITDDTLTTGRCMCGAIRYALTGKPRWVMHCHCASCRRAVSSVVATYVGVKTARFRYTAGTPKGYSGSPGVTRHFCGDCGTPIAYTGARWPDEVHLYHGTLDDPAAWLPTGHAHVVEQIPWFEVHDDLPRYEEVAAKGALPVRVGPKQDAIKG